MNKIYRLVWNKSLNLWTVVSENARGVTKKRNVTANTATVSSVSLSFNLQYQHLKLKPSLIALAISSFFFSSGAFAAANTDGGVANGSSMAISPSSGACGTGGQATVSGNNGTALGCGNNISGTDATFQQGVNNRRGAGTIGFGAGVPTGNQGAIHSASTAVGRQNIIRGAGGATVVGNANVSNSGGNFTNVLMGQGNSVNSLVGYNTVMGIGNQIADAANANPNTFAGAGSNSIAIGVANKVTGQTSIAFGRQSYAEADYAIAQGSTATVTSGATGGIALGNSATTSGLRGIAIGSGTGGNDYDPASAPAAGGTDSIAVGTGAKATSVESTAIGRVAQATGGYSSAFGKGAEATAQLATAAGHNAKASGSSAVAVGDKAQASGQNTVAVGAEANAGSVAQAGALVDNWTPESTQRRVDYGAGNTSLGYRAQSNNNGTAVGTSTQASGAASFAGGAGANASGRIGVAVGGGSLASGDSAVALGNTATASGAQGVAMGAGASARGNGGTALGKAAFATGNNSTAAGTNAKAAGVSSVATGDNAQAKSANDIAIGRNAATAEGSEGDNIAMGNGVTTGDTGKNVAMGSDGTTANSRTASGGAVAIGRDQVAQGDGAVAIGDPNRANGDGAVALGKDNTAAGNTAASTAANGAVAIGNTNQAIGQGSVAIGNTSKASAAGTIALGDTANAANTRDIAMGQGASARGVTENGIIRTATAIGSGANADGRNTLAVGEASSATGSGANALGAGAEATADFTTATGNQAKATAGHATAIGNFAEASGVAATVMGSTAKASGETSSAFGALSNASGIESTAIGAGAQASSDYAVALGGETQAQATRGTALGSNAVATNENDVALGAGSQTSTATGTGYRTGTAAPSSVVSVGTAGNERRIQNLSDGAADTDAVNVRQLKNVQGGVDQLGESTANALGGGSIYNPNTGAISAPRYDVDRNSPASNVGDAFTRLSRGWTIQSNSGEIDGNVKAGDEVFIGKDSEDDNIKVYESKGTPGDSNRHFYDIRFGINRDLDLDSVTTGDTVMNDNGVTIANGPSMTKDGINAGDTTVSNVADGVAPSDAVNKGQLDKAAAASKTEVTEGKNITVTKTTGTDGQDIYNVATSDDVSFDSVQVGDVNIDGTTGKISGVTAGEVSATSDEAINGSQLAGTAKSVSDALGGGSTVNPDGTVTAPSYTVNGNNVSNVGAAISELDKGWNLQSNGAKAGAVKAGDTVDIGTVAGEENLTVTKDGNNIKYGLNRDLKVDSVRAGDTLINDNGVTITNGPSITKSGINAAGNTISNVGAGVAGTDAVNKDQLDDAAAAAKTEVTQGKNITVSKTTGADGQDIYNVATADNVDFNNVTVGDVTIDGTTGKISGVTAGEVSATSDEAINGSQLAGTAKSVSDALGGGSTVNPDGTVTAPSYTVNGETVRNVGDAITELDKGWNLQSNGANAGAIRTGDTVDIGTVAGEENLTVTKDGNNIKYGLNRDLKVDSVRAGDTLINDNGVTISNGPSITKSGINAAGNPISNVGAGVEDTDAVNKGQLDKAAAAAKTEVTQGKNITVSKTTGLDGQDIYNVATADNVDFNNVTVGGANGVNIDGATGKISGVTAGEVSATSDEAINGSQLAGTAKSVSDALGGGSTVNPDGTVTAPSYTVNGNNVSNVGAAISELDKGWSLQSNGANGASIKAGDTVDIGTVAGEENLTVTKDGNNIKYGLNRDLKVDSVRAGDTLINDNGVTISNGPSITKSGINAAGNPISNVGAGVDDTDAVNKGQLDKAAAASKTEVTQGKNITVTKTTGLDGQDIYNVATADNVDFNNVTVGGANGVNIDGNTGKISGVTAGEVSATSDEAINGSQLAGTAKSVSDALGGGSVVNPDGTVTAPSYTVNGNNVSNVGAAISELDKGWNLQTNGAGADAIKAGDTVDIGTVAGEENLTVTKDGNNIKYGLNRDLKVESVRAGDTLINDNGVTISNGPSITKSGINAAGNPISNVGAGVDDTDAVNKGQLDKAAAASKTEVTQGKNITVTKTTGLDGQDIYNVATADNVDFNNVTVGGANGVNIDGNTGKISGVTAGEVSATSDEAINGSQLAGTAKSVSDALGGGSTVNPDGTVTAPSYTVNGNNVTNVGAAISELDKGWNLQSNGAKAGAVKAGDTVDIGTVAGEENLTVSKNGNTIQYGLNKDLKVDRVTAGDTVINTDGVTIANGPSITKDGINAGDTTVSNVADGVAPSDAVNKGQLDKAAAAAKTEVTQGKNITVSKTTGADGQDIYNVATADNVDFNNVTVGGANGVNIDGATGKISGVTAGEVSATSDEAINGSQLEGTAKSVSDALGGGSTVNPDGTVTAPSYTVNGNNVTNVGAAISELDKGWNLQTNGANAGAVKAGDTVDIGTATGEENLTVTKDGNNIKYGLNRDLKVDSVRAGDTLINDNGVTIANGPSITKSGINAAGNPISNVGAGVAGTDAVNKDQLDDAAAAAKTEVTQGKNITVSKTTGADGQDIYNVATKDDVSFDSVQVGDVNIDGTTGKISGVTDGTVAAGSNDAVNGGQLNDSVASTGDILGGGVTNEGGKLNGPFTVNDKGYDTVADAIQGEAAAAKTEVTEGKNVTVTKTTGADGQDIYNVATKDDVSFDSVQVGDVNIDGTTGKISGVTDGTIAAGSKDAVNGGQLHGVADSVRNSIGGETTLNPDGSITTANVGNTGENNIHDAIDSVRGQAVAAKTEVEAGKNMTVESRTGTDGQTIYEVATADDVSFDSVQVGDVNIDAATGKISGVADGTVAAGSKDAVNGGQLNDSVASTGDILGGGVTNQGGKLNGPFTVSGKGYDTVADAIQGEAAAAKTEVTEGKNITVTKTTGADGQDIYNVATKDDVSFDSVQVGDVNIDGATGKISGVADGTIAAGSKDAVNGGQIHGIADSVKNSIGGETTLNPDGSITTGNVGNTGQNNIHDAIDSVRGQAVAAKTTVTEGDNMVVTQTKNADGSTNYEVATARDVDFDSVQVGDVNIDGATGKISGVADGTIAAGSKDAVNGGQLNDSVASTGDILGGGVTNEGGKLNGPFTVSGKGYDTVADAIQGEAAAAKTEVTEGKNVTVTKTTGADGQDIYNVATKDDVSFDSVQVGDVNIDGTTGKITGVADGTVAAGSKDAVNGGQLNDSVASTGDILGGGVTNEGGKLNGPFTVSGKGYDTVADAIQGEAAAAKTEVTEGKNVTVTKTTGADGQDIYNVATKDDVSFDSVQVGDVNIDGTTGKISGVADGTIAAGSTEAINGGQIHAIADSVKNSIGGETTLNPDGSITTGNVGNTGQNNIHDAIDSVRGQAVAAKTTVTEGDNMVVTQSKNADGSTNYEVATAKDVKFDSVTATDADGNETILDAKGVSLKDQAGNTTILGQDGLGFADPMGNSVGPRISARGIDAGNTVITGVAPGRIAADSTDAINGSQLKGVADSVAGAIGGNTTVNSDGSINTSNIGGTGKDNINDAIGAVGKAAQAAKTTVSKADGDENVTVTSRPNDEGGTDFQVGLSKDIKVDSVTAGDTVINGDGLTIAGGPSVTKDGIDAGDNKVTGVADGTIAAGSKDAINGGQLHDVADSVKNVVGGNAKVNPDGSITTSNVGGTGKNNIDDAINSVRGAAAAAKSTVSNKDGNISVNETTKADGSKDYEVGLAKDIQVDSVTAANQVNVGGAGGTTIAADGVRIAEGPSMTKEGINAGGKKVTGVADGAIASGSQDGINGGQLHRSYEDVGKALGGGAGYDPEKGWKGPSYDVAGGKYDNVGDALGAIDNRVTNLGDQLQQAFYDTNKRMDKLEDKMSAGIAATAALENAPFVPGKLTMAAGAAYYNEQSAIGVTFRKTADNGRWSLTTGAAMGSQGNSPLVRVGVSTIID
ncbi:ESPR-type extended signal peptide-containing protein [Acinetobacter higginsii]|uniref:ESPR-type extended signal peptide-containing protein n=1 Tax=Acinetobacter higginsii TaxID=70347 RepID=UPI0030098476